MNTWLSPLLTKSLHVRLSGRLRDPGKCVKVPVFLLHLTLLDEHSGASRRRLGENAIEWDTLIWWWWEEQHPLHQRKRYLRPQEDGGG